jgi:hypothetical protein
MAFSLKWLFQNKALVIHLIFQFYQNQRKFGFCGTLNTRLLFCTPGDRFPRTQSLIFRTGDELRPAFENKKMTRRVWLQRQLE